MSMIKSPTQLREEQAQGLILLLSDIKVEVVEDIVILKNVVLRLNGVLERFYDHQDTQLSTADKLKRHILILERRKCESILGEPRCNIHDIAEDTKTLCDSIIAEVKALGIPIWKAADKSVNVSTTVTQSQEQKQNQRQDVVIRILLEAAKDELTGRQRKELLAIAGEIKDPMDARKGILPKLKEFGEDVTANIVANILTNPLVWQNLGSLL